MATKISRVRRCFHCGAILQTTDKNDKGYIDEKTINMYDNNALLYCNNCYNDLRNYNSSQVLNPVESEVINILKDANATDAFIIWVVDLFSFNGNLPKEVVKMVKHLKVSVVGTKRDLFSQYIDDDTFIRYLNERFKASGIKPYSVRLFGSEDEINAPQLMEAINIARQGHDVYLIGSLTSGKTSLINRMMKNFENKSKWHITIDEYPGTNVKVLTVPLSNSSFFYELPGFENNDSILNKIEKPNTKYLTPRKKVSITTKILNEHDALMVGNLATFTLQKGVQTTVRFYSAEDVEIKKTKSSHIDEINAENIRRRFIRPVSDRFTHFSDYDVFSFEVEDDEKVHDISIQGLGWFSFIGKGQTFFVSLPKGVAVKECPGKIR